MLTMGISAVLIGAKMIIAKVALVGIGIEVGKYIAKQNKKEEE